MFGLLSRLDRMVIKETLRSVGYTLAVVLVLAVFGAALRPLGRGDFDSAREMGEFFILVALPMLEYVLPLAAGLGATLSVHRMVNDGEVVTAAACGRSPVRVIFPVAVGGAVAGVVLAVLSNFIVPLAWASSEKVISRSLAAAIANSVERGDAFDTGEAWIHASDGIRLGPDERAGLEDRVQLDQVTIVSKDEAGTPQSDISARSVDILVYTSEKNAPRELELRMRDAVISRPEDGVLASVADPKSLRMYDPEDPRRRRAKLQPTPELWRWMEEPDRSPEVMKVLKEIARFERDQRVLSSLDDRLRVAGFVEFRSPGDGEIWQLSSTGMSRSGLCVGPVGLRRLSGDPSQTLTSDSAEIRVVEAGLSGSGAMAKILTGADADFTGLRVLMPQAQVGQAPERRDVVLSDLQLSSVDMEARSLTWQELEPRLDSLRDDHRELLVDIVEEERNKSLAFQQFRLAMPATIPGLALLGASLALRMRGRPLLLVWTMAYIPAILSMLLVVAGSNAVRTGVENGHLILAMGPGLPLLAGICASLRTRPA